MFGPLSSKFVTRQSWPLNCYLNCMNTRRNPRSVRVTGPPRSKKNRHPWRIASAAFLPPGAGLITSAADDDRSGISTYSVTGAAFGYPPLWTALFLSRWITAVQMMCARLGMLTGEGLAGFIRQHYPRWVCGAPARYWSLPTPSTSTPIAAVWRRSRKW